MKISKIYLIFLLLLSSFVAHGQSDNRDSLSLQDKIKLLSNPGDREYWLCYMLNDVEKDNRTKLELYVTSDEEAMVNVQIKAINFNRNIYVNSGSFRKITIDTNATVKKSGVIEKDMAVHITSDKNILVYALSNRPPTSTESYMILPSRYLGKKYRVISYYTRTTKSATKETSSQFAIIATEDNTKVKIIPSVVTESDLPADKPSYFTLGKGDVLQIRAKYENLSLKQCDLSGSLIEADKNIAVFSGHQCANVPVLIKSCNHLIEQIPPLESWGKNFVVGKLKTRSKYNLRVLAQEDETIVTINEEVIDTLDAGEFLEDIYNDNLMIKSDKPVLVAQYSQGSGNGDNTGDPMMLLITPISRFLKKYRFATPVEGMWRQFVNIVVHSNSINNIKQNNQLIDSTVFTQLGQSQYSVAQIEIPYGEYTFEGNLPFGLYYYGFGIKSNDFDAYGTMGGQSSFEFDLSKDTLKPEIEGIQGKGESFSLIFKDKRIDDTGLMDIKVYFNEGMEIDIPEDNFIGMPEYEIPIKPLFENKSARAVLKVRDFALNTTFVTVCYSYDKETGRLSYNLNEGIVEDCESPSRFEVGLFGQYSFINHTPDFSNTADLTSNGKFNESSGSGGDFGFKASYDLLPNVKLAARIGFENYSGNINSPDSMITKIRDSQSGGLLDYQEEYILSLDGMFMNLSFAADYYFLQNLYAFAGLNMSFALSKDVQYQKHILIPTGFTYQNESNYIDIPRDEKSLESIKSMRFGVFAGLGLSIPVYKQYSAFVEAKYNYHFGSLIDDGDWNIGILSTSLGVKYRF